jgi:hypothetical protein
VKLKYVALGCLDEGQSERNIAYAKSLGLPDVPAGRGLSQPLAIVGGGPSINDHLAELQSWPGDIWAVNGAWRWCERHGIDATFFSVDSAPTLVWLAQGARKAILGTLVDRTVFDALPDVQIFDAGFIAGLATGPTSVTCAPALALHAGYGAGGITLFGCEGSYRDGSTHAYHDDAPNPYRIKVRCGGQEYLSEAEYHMQCQYLVQFLKSAPHIFMEKSGGLLRAMANHDDDDVIAATRELISICRVEEAA